MYSTLKFLVTSGYNVFDEDDGPEALSNYKASQVRHSEEYFAHLENEQRLSMLQEAALAYEQGS